MHTDPLEESLNFLAAGRTGGGGGGGRGGVREFQVVIKKTDGSTTISTYARGVVASHRVSIK
jgi:hypothetical protein